MNTLSKCDKDIMRFTGNFTCEYIRLSITSDKQSINFKIYCFCLFSRLRFFCIREEFFRLLFWNILKSATNRRSRIPARYKKSSNSSQANSEIFRFSYWLHSRWQFFCIQFELFYKKRSGHLCVLRKIVYRDFLCKIILYIFYGRKNIKNIDSAVIVGGVIS